MCAHVCNIKAQQAQKICKAISVVYVNAFMCVKTTDFSCSCCFCTSVYMLVSYNKDQG